MHLITGATCLGGGPVIEVSKEWGVVLWVRSSTDELVRGCHGEGGSRARVGGRGLWEFENPNAEVGSTERNAKPESVFRNQSPIRFLCAKTRVRSIGTKSLTSRKPETNVNLLNENQSPV